MKSAGFLEDWLLLSGVLDRIQYMDCVGRLHDQTVAYAIVYLENHDSAGLLIGQLDLFTTGADVQRRDRKFLRSRPGADADGQLLLVVGNAH